MSRKEKPKKVKEKKKRSTSVIGVIIFVGLSVFLVRNLFILAADIKEKNEKYEALNEMYQEEMLIRDEYEYLLDDENRLEYIERIAREKYGYVAPGERAFYDSSYGK